ncbi:MAG: hypothetical protein ABIJ65_15140 [Chloroflexota bacterium]
MDSNQESHNTLCTICSQLADCESASQKVGWEQEATYLPPASKKLQIVKDFAPFSSRAKQLLQCPECDTYYLYTSDYEFLVNGTEDSDLLTRLTNTKAKEYLDQSG